MKTNPLAPDFEKIVCTIHGVRYGYCPECLFGKPSEAFGDTDCIPAPAAKEDGIPEKPQKDHFIDFWKRNGAKVEAHIASVASLQEPEGELPPLLVTAEDIESGKTLRIDPTLQPDNLTDMMGWWVKLFSWFGGAVRCRERQLLAALAELRKLRSQESK